MIITFDELEFPNGLLCYVMEGDEKIGVFRPSGRKIRLKNLSPGIIIPLEDKMNNDVNRLIAWHIEQGRGHHELVITHYGIVSIHREFLRTPEGDEIS